MYVRHFSHIVTAVAILAFIFLVRKHFFAVKN
jgi:hypothetical protein